MSDFRSCSYGPLTQIHPAGETCVICDGRALKDAAAKTERLCQQLATVAMNPKVADYLPFGLKDEVEAWLKS